MTLTSIQAFGNLTNVVSFLETLLGRESGVSVHTINKMVEKLLLGTD